MTTPNPGFPVQTGSARSRSPLELAKTAFREVGGAWSFVNGLIAVLAGLWESFWAAWLSANSQRERFRVVQGVWQERSPKDVVLYFAGNAVFLCWPAILTAINVGPKSVWSLCSCILFVMFGFLSLSTLAGPVGARARYGWLTGEPRTSYERLFLGLMPPRLLFAARGRGASTCVIEVVCAVLLVSVAAACTEYAIWSASPLAFNIHQGHAAVFSDFLFWSAISITTTGYGDMYPVSGIAQFVAVGAIALGWMYLAGLLPSLLASTMSYGATSGSTQTQLAHSHREVIDARDAAIDWLCEHRQATGSWRARLSSDLVASAAGLVALERDSKMLTKRGRSGLANLRVWVEAALSASDGEDSTASAVCRIALDPLSVEMTEFESLLRATKESQHGVETHAVVPVLLIAAFLRPDLKGALQAWRPKDIAEWPSTYGPHWGTYTLLESLALDDLGNDAKNGLVTKLVAQRNSSYTWHGDVLLTSVAMLALQAADSAWTARNEVHAWFEKLLADGTCGLPVVSSLEVWDTAWATAAVLRSGRHPDIVERGILALVDSPGWNGTEMAWSWSGDCSLVCLDCTSLACEVIHRAALASVRVERTWLRASGTIRKSPNGHRFPTFIQGGESFEHCPIISARCLSTLPFGLDDRRQRAAALLGDVSATSSQKTWVSPWYVDACLTHGLVAHYLAGVSATESPEVRALALRLIEGAANAEHLGPEVLAGILLGLGATSHVPGLEAKIAFAESRIVDRLVAIQQDGKWAGSRVGVFGFGRTYGDDVFATSIAAIALSNYC